MLNFLEKEKIVYIIINLQLENILHIQDAEQ